MIDYEKLKLSFELAEKLTKPASLCLNVGYGGIESVYGVLNYDYNLLEVKHDGVFKFTCIEHLIGKLQELTKPKPKFKVGDTLWLVAKNDIKSFSVDEINIMNGVFIYEDKYWSAEEKNLYPTRESLIEAQIKRWQSMLHETYSVSESSKSIDDKNPCDHIFVLLADDPECIKCGIAYDEKYTKLKPSSTCEKQECQHERDINTEPKLSHFTSEEGCVFIVKCKKCGEFYR